MREPANVTRHRLRFWRRLGAQCGHQRIARRSVDDLVGHVPLDGRRRRLVVPGRVAEKSVARTVRQIEHSAARHVRHDNVGADLRNAADEVNARVVFKTQSVDVG